MDQSHLEKFYVYRSLGEEERWGALILDSGLGRLPNISFGMRIFAINEKAAIARARNLYEEIHKYDSDKDNVRRFACSILKQTRADGMDADSAAGVSLKYAIAMNKVFKNYFDPKVAEKLRAAVSLDNEEAE